MANQVNNAVDVPVLESQRLTIAPPLDDADEWDNLSGAACTGAGVCLLIGDEKRYAHFFTLSGDVLTPAGRLFLLPKNENGVRVKESDGEGVAFADGQFYLIGSHSQTKLGEAQASRHFVFRIPFGAPTAPTADLGSETAPAPGLQRATLDPIIRNHPLLAPHAAEAPGDTPPDGSAPAHGVNIEGIAVAGDDIFVGFRGPVDGNGALILRLSASALFGGTDATAETHRVPLGAGQGVRDLAAVRGGVLILSGPERRNNVEPRPELFLWRPNAAPILLGRIAREPGADNPESITVLEETADAYRLLVLWDGEAHGIPMIVRVPKPRL